MVLPLKSGTGIPRCKDRQGQGRVRVRGARAMESLGLGLGFSCELYADWWLVAAPQKEQGPELLRSGPVVLLHYLKWGGRNI